MPASAKHVFEYVSDLNGFRAPGWHVVRIGGQLNRKQDLLRVLADKLKLPSYFGDNWDSLEECVRDLSWLKSESGVVLLHEQLPLADDDQRQTYASILRSAQSTGSVPLRVIFPASARDRLRPSG